MIRPIQLNRGIESVSLITMEDNLQTKNNNISLIVLFGLLSVICAEVFSGSAPLWMYDLWGLLIVLPLYWGHGLILWNVALEVISMVK